jgi:NAD(P)-dependent dehydrogenase (short-subunit alcohol dehydrogenase family)
MTNESIYDIFSIKNKVAAITGGTGVLCSVMCRALGNAGARMVVLGHRQERAEALAEELKADGVEAIGLACNVVEKSAVDAAANAVMNKFGRIDILINGAGGNHPQATAGPGQSFFDLPPEALRSVFDLNLMGTIIPSQVFGKLMAEQHEGVILNISSMGAIRPLTRIAAYSAAKAAVSNFTQWLAVTMARDYSPEIRVNAIAPGFFLTEQNRYLLTDKETGGLTPRGSSIIAQTPQGHFGTPADLIGAMLWLVSPASSFVTGTVIPVDGGFSAFSGV